MNTIALNSIINTIVPAPKHTMLIDNIELTTEVLSVDIAHSDDEGEIEIETLTIDSNGTMMINGFYISSSDPDLLSYPYHLREVLAFFIVALRDGEVHGDHPELELIAANKQFFLDREEAFVPAGVLCAAGIVDEHNMEIDE